MLAFPAESCVTKSTNLPWLYFSGATAFLIKDLRRSSFIVGCSLPPLPALFQAEERGVQERPPPAFDPFVTLLSQFPSPSCGRGKGALGLDTASRVPTAELAAPSGGNPESRPCFSRKIPSSSPTHKVGGSFAGRGFWHRAVFR